MGVGMRTRTGMPNKKVWAMETVMGWRNQKPAATERVMGRLTRRVWETQMELKNGEGLHTILHDIT